MALDAAAALRLGVTQPRPARGGTCLVTESDEVVVHIAVDDSGRRLLDAETRRLRWATGIGVGVPDVVETGEGVLVTRRVPRDPLRGPAAVEAAVAAADAIAAAVPPPRLAEESRSWRGNRRTLLRRVSRGARHGVDWRRFAGARAAAARLSDLTLAHGDFTEANLLWDTADGRLRVVDWEYLAPAPRHTDLLNLWTQTTGVDERAALVDEVERRTTTATQRRHAADLLVWLAHRHHAQVATGLPTDGAEHVWREQLAAAAERVRESAQLARRWCG